MHYFIFLIFDFLLIDFEYAQPYNMRSAKNMICTQCRTIFHEENSFFQQKSYISYVSKKFPAKSYFTRCIICPEIPRVF